MSESTLRQLQVLIERAVRPVRASAFSKRRIREELLAHVTAVFEEELARVGGEQAAIDRTAERFGDPADLTGQLQASVPAFDSVRRYAERIAELVSFRPGESALRRAARFSIIIEAAAILFLLAMTLLLRRMLGAWPTEAVLWQVFPVLFICGYVAFSTCIFEVSIRRLLCAQKRSAWIQFAVLLVGSAIVSMPVGLLAYGVTPQKAAWLFVFTVASPVSIACLLARHCNAQKRDPEDWVSLQIE
jgi:hypothetical protein